MPGEPGTGQRASELDEEIAKYLKTGASDPAREPAFAEDFDQMPRPSRTSSKTTKTDPVGLGRTAEGNHMRQHRGGGRSNQREIDVITQEVIPPRLVIAHTRRAKPSQTMTKPTERNQIAPARRVHAGPQTRCWTPLPSRRRRVRSGT
jgi:hypothetical protein